MMQSLFVQKFLRKKRESTFSNNSLTITILAPNSHEVVDTVLGSFLCPLDAVSDVLTGLL